MSCRFLILVDYSEHHWIYILSTVQVYDSLSKGLTLDTKKQIEAILHLPDEEIKLDYTVHKCQL